MYNIVPTVPSAQVITRERVALGAAYNYLFTPTLPPIELGKRVEKLYEGLPYSGRRGSYDPKAAETFFAKQPKVAGFVVFESDDLYTFRHSVIKILLHVCIPTLNRGGFAVQA